jgi:uncharacterized protein YlxW (UPF0749 family)
MPEPVDPSPRRAIEEPVPGSAASTESSPPSTDGRRRLLRSLVKPGRGQLIAAAMLFVVGMAGVMQIRANSIDSTYAGARREDLIVLLDGLGEQSRRLESEISDLERTRSELQSGVDSRRVAREEARQRVDDLSILAGTAPAIGPGIRMRIDDPAHKMTADVLLDAVEEMRDAGAEVIEINDSVRVVASTWFGTESGTLVVDGAPIRSPYVLEVVGEPHGLEEAARFRGGIVSEITGPRIGGQVQIEQQARVVVDSLHAQTKNQYAQPATPQPTPR